MPQLNDCRFDALRAQGFVGATNDMLLIWAQIKEYLTYNPDTGIFHWIKKPNRNIAIGSIAGSKTKRGYITVMLKKKHYQAHRLAFWFMTGDFPVDMVDHINRITDDNRWCNLRQVDAVGNQNNTKANNVVVGVNFNSWKGKWTARSTSVNNVRKSLGDFDTFLEAVFARIYWENKNAAA